MRTSLAALILSLSLATTAQAAPITLTFGGTITGFFGNMATLAPELHVGDPFVGTIEFINETTIPGLYASANVKYVMGSYWVSAKLPPLVGPISLTNALLMYGENSNIGPMNWVSLHFQSLDPSLGEISFGIARGFSGGSAGGAIGRIHPTPEPGTWLLSALGIFATQRWVSRRRSARS